MLSSGFAMQLLCARVLRHDASILQRSGEYFFIKGAFDKFSSAPFHWRLIMWGDLLLQHYVDGGFSSMQPSLPVPCNQILTVSPFSGEVDICPADTPSMWDVVVSGSTLKGNMANSIRILNALYPMTLEVKHSPLPLLLSMYYMGLECGLSWTLTHFITLN